MAEIREPLARLPNSELQALRAVAKAARKAHTALTVADFGSAEQRIRAAEVWLASAVRDLDRHDSSQSASSQRGAE